MTAHTVIVNCTCKLPDARQERSSAWRSVFTATLSPAGHAEPLPSHFQAPSKSTPRSLQACISDSKPASHIPALFPSLWVHYAADSDCVNLIHRPYFRCQSSSGGPRSFEKPRSAATATRRATHRRAQSHASGSVFGAASRRGAADTCEVHLDQVVSD